MLETGPDLGRRARQSRGGASLKRVGSFLSRYSMLGNSSRVGVAVSGGSDSMALLHLLGRLAGELQLDLTVLHLNHGLRGEESDGDQQFVMAQAGTLDLEYVVGHAAGAPESNVEAWARRARLEFFAAQKVRLGLDAVATGHTRDDQTETVLLRLLRGAGATGIAGILPGTREGLIRPLLECTRAELREWLEGHGISWREDQTNLDPEFARRNRIRLELLPMLKREWNPGIDQALAQMARLAQDEEEYWAGEVARLVPTVEDGAILFDVKWLGAMAVAVQRRVMRAAIARVKGDLRRIEFQHVEMGLALVRRRSGDGRARLPGVLMERSFGRLRVSLEGAAICQTVGWREVVPGEEANGAYNKGRYYLDATKVTLPLELRSWRAGDELPLLAGAGPKSMKEWFQQERVPSWERRDWPMLVSSGTIVWARGLGVADGYEAAAGSSRILEVCDESLCR